MSPHNSTLKKQSNTYFLTCKIGLAMLALFFTTTLTAQDVYLGGYYNDGSSSNIAQIWEGDGSKQDLTNGSDNAYVYGVFVYDGDVYAAGHEFNGASFVAKIWKNGTAQNLTNGSENAYAQDVFVYDDDVYVAGYESNGSKYVAKVWKNGNVQNLTDGSENARAKSVFVSDDDVYVLGIEYDFSVDGSFADSTIKIWKNGTAQDLTNGVNDVYAESMFVDDGDVYVAGGEYNGTNYLAKLWKNGNAQNLTDGSRRARAYSVFISNGDVYVGGHDGPFPRLWKNGVEETLNYNTNKDGGKVYSLYVSGSDVYVAGTITESNNDDVCNYAAFWKNGQVEFTDSAPACTDNTAIYSVFADDDQLSTTTIEDPKNSVNLYPNPVEDVLNIDTKTGNIQAIELFSITGQRLQTWEGQPKINLSSLTSGSYFIKISTADNQTVTKQIIKK